MSTGKRVGLAVMGLVAAVWAQRIYADSHAPYVLVEEGDIQPSVFARGLVVASGGTVRVMPTSVGRVIAVRVEVGDHVEADQMLAPLEMLGPTQPFDPLGEDEGLRAPIEGVVLSRAVDVGDLVSPLAPTLVPLFEIADTSALELRLEIEERDADAVEPGATAHLGDREIQIERLAPRIERREHPFDDVASRASAAVRLAWARLPEGASPILGEHVEVRIETAVVHAETMLPRDAITIRDGHPVLRVRDGMSVRELRVTLGAVDDENVEVHGVDVGTEVLLAP